MRDVVSYDFSALHDKFDSLKFGNVGQRIAGNRDKIGVLALIDRSDSIRPSKHLCINDGSGLDSPCRAHPSALDQRLKVEGLRIVREPQLRFNDLVTGYELRKFMIAV